MPRNRIPLFLPGVEDFQRGGGPFAYSELVAYCGYFTKTEVRHCACGDSLLIGVTAFSLEHTQHVGICHQLRARYYFGVTVSR